MMIRSPVLSHLWEDEDDQTLLVHEEVRCVCGQELVQFMK